MYKNKRRLKYAFMSESKFLVGIKTKRNCREREEKNQFYIFYFIIRGNNYRYLFEKKNF